MRIWSAPATLALYVLMGFFIGSGRGGALMAANGDIMLRTLSRLAGFAIFTDRGARFGAETLAANHLLLQLVSFSAFFLDGFAYVAEALAGRAFGAKGRAGFAAVVQRSTQLAAATAVLLAIVLWWAGSFFIAQLTTLAPIVALARNFLPFCAAYVLVSFAAFQLDGIFIGTMQTRALRNAALISTAVFALLAFLLASYFGNAGLWSAFVGFVIVRALSLGAHYPRAFAALK